jgi:hypothetical protein
MIKILRLLSHEEILCEATETDTGWIIKEPMLIVPSENGIGLMAFMPYSTIENDDTEIKKEHVLFVTTAVEGLVEKYKSLFSKIYAPTPSIIV